MADKADKKGQEWSFEKRGISDYVPTPKTLQVICLRKMGWDVKQVAQACSVSERQVYRLCEEAQGFLDDLPELQAARDAIQSLIPKAIEVFEETLKGKSKTLAADVATKILISNKVIADRKVIEDEREQSTGKLVDEAERILAGVGDSSARSSEAGSDTDGTPGA